MHASVRANTALKHIPVALCAQQESVFHRSTHHGWKALPASAFLGILTSCSTVARWGQAIRPSSIEAVRPGLEIIESACEMAQILKSFMQMRLKLKVIWFLSFHCWAQGKLAANPTNYGRDRHVTPSAMAFCPLAHMAMQNAKSMSSGYCRDSISFWCSRCIYVYQHLVLYLWKASSIASQRRWAAWSPRIMFHALKAFKILTGCGQMMVDVV